jgi:hypothetical protein
MPQMSEWREQSHKKFVKFAHSFYARLKETKLSSNNEKAVSPQECIYSIHHARDKISKITGIIRSNLAGSYGSK